MFNFNFKKKKKTTRPNDQMVLVDSKNFRFVEAYKSLRTNILFSLQHKEGCRKIMVTSSFQGEGKSVISTNLAACFAQMGSSVLIVDCDLRRSRVHKYLNLKSNPGLANILGGFIDVSTAIQKTSIANLFALSGGVIPPNPSELIGSSRMEMLVKELEKAFDYIIFDTPPVNVVSDALSLVNLVDGVVVVVSQNLSNSVALTKCVQSLEFANAKILGVVFNNVDKNTSGLDYKYGYRSKYYYKNYYYKRPYEN